MRTYVTSVAGSARQRASTSRGFDGLGLVGSAARRLARRLHHLQLDATTASSRSRACPHGSLLRSSRNGDLRPAFIDLVEVVNPFQLNSRGCRRG